MELQEQLGPRGVVEISIVDKHTGLVKMHTKKNTIQRQLQNAMAYAIVNAADYSLSSLFAAWTVYPTAGDTGSGIVHLQNPGTSPTDLASSFSAAGFTVNFKTTITGGGTTASNSFVLYGEWEPDGSYNFSAGDYQLAIVRAATPPSAEQIYSLVAQTFNVTSADRVYVTWTIYF